MSEYLKIETLFNRGEDFAVDPTLGFRRPEFACIKEWVATEKIDGTNIRLMFCPAASEYEVRGKTDNASIHPKLLARCQELCGRISGGVADICERFGVEYMVLYGEGYGAKIQNGGLYRPDQDFILFDIAVGSDIDDLTILGEDAVAANADELELARVPVLGVWTTEKALEVVQRGFTSWTAQKERFAEGVVLRTPVPLYDQRGDRVIAKLKQKDFRRKGVPRGKRPSS